MAIGSDHSGAWGPTLIACLQCLFRGHKYSKTYTEHLNGYDATFIECDCGVSILTDLGARTDDQTSTEA